jgi:hypothetical protein
MSPEQPLTEKERTKLKDVMNDLLDLTDLARTLRTQLDALNLVIELRGKLTEE